LAHEAAEMNAGRPPVAEEADHWYVDKTSGIRLAFRPKADEAVVTFAVEGSPDEALSRVVRAAPIRSVSRGANLARGFAAVYVAPGRRAGEVAADVPAVANAMPVMVDPDGLPRYFLPDELTVRFREGVDPASAETIIRERGSEILVRQRTPGYYTVSVPAGHGLFETIRAFSDQPEVAFAEPSEAGFNDALPYLPDDADFLQLWGMRNTGQTVNGAPGTSGIDIDATLAWDLHRGDPDVIVAVIDTGADLDHPDLEANLLPRGGEDWDFADSGDPSPDDGDGHGTHVAGTAAGVDNLVGVIGVAPNCRIMPLRVDLTAGMNQNRADAIDYVRRQATANPSRRYVVNCSWRTSGDHAGVRTAIADAVAANVVVVFAAGNANVNTDVTPQYPGVYPQVIAVAALDQQGLKASFSNFGGNVDVCAPGVNIFSSLPDDTHGFLDGTSMAAPHVTGLAALVWSAAPGLTGAQVRRIIEDTCDDVDGLNPGFPGQLGRGRINAFRAVQLAQFTAAYVPSVPALL
jgi:subtilisin family serine protease